MMYHETIPALVVETVRSIYRPYYIEDYGATAARLGDFFDTGPLVADITTVLSQFAVVISVALAAFIVFVAMQRRALKSQSAAVAEASSAGPARPSPVPTGVLRERWGAIVAHLDSVRETDWKNAVMEADKLVDDSLARAGFPGATFGDRLSNIQPGTLLSLDGVWWAHKIRNRLAHEVDYFLRYTEARQAVGYYEAALAELNLI